MKLIYLLPISLAFMAQGICDEAPAIEKPASSQELQSDTDSSKDENKMSSSTAASPKDAQQAEEKTAQKTPAPAPQPVARQRASQRPSQTPVVERKSPQHGWHYSKTIDPKHSNTPPPGRQRSVSTEQRQARQPSASQRPSRNNTSE